MYKPNKLKVANRLKSIRKELKLTVEQMAKKLGISRGTFDSYLRALALPPEHIVEKICELAEVDKFWIYYGDAHDLIEDCISNLEYDELINDNPNLINELSFKYETSLKDIEVSLISLDYSEIVNRKIDLAHKIIKSKYEDLFRKYIYEVSKDLLPDFHDRMSQLLGTTLSDDWIIDKILDEINKGVPKPKYGELEKVLSVSKDVISRIMYGNYFSEDSKVYTSGPTFLDVLIREFSSESGIKEILKYIANKNGVTIDSSSREYDLIVDTLRKNSRDLVDVIKPEKL